MKATRKLALAIVAAGFAVATAQAETIVYVGTTENNEIEVLRLDPADGNLSEIDKTPVPGLAKAGDTSTPMTVSPDGRFLFVVTRGVATVSTFSIDPASGKFTHVANAALPGGMAEGWAYISTDQSGRYLLSAATDGHKVAVSPIDKNGKVGAVQQIVDTAPKAHSIVTDPTNHFVLVASLNGDLIHQYRFDPGTGRLSPNDPALARVKEKAGPRHLVFSSSGKLVYVLNELDASVNVFDFDPKDGTLSHKQLVPTLPPDFADKSGRAADLHLTPDGKYLYVCERHTSTIVAFRVDSPDGTLTVIGRYPTEKQPRGFNIDPSGTYLLAVGQLSHSMTTYRIDKGTGELTRLKHYPMSKNPNWVEVVDLP